MKTDDGYTLVELLVVMAIIAMVSVSIPFAYGRLVPSAELNKTAREVANELRLVAAQARGSGSDIVLAFPAEGGPLNLPNERKLPLPANIALAYEPLFPNSSDENGGVTFYGEGGSTGGVLTLQRGSGRRALEINWLTGHVSLEDAS